MRAAERASAIDVKSFCAAPVHAIVVAAALIEAGIEERVVVVAGGSLGKLGMKFEGALSKGFPVIEDVLAGMAVLLEPADGSNGPVVRTDAVGRMPVDAGSAPQAQLEALVGRRSMRWASKIGDIDRYATEIHNPEITEPQGGGDVADRNYKMLAGLGRRARRTGTLRHRRVRPRSRVARASPRRRATSPARCRGSRTRSIAWRPATCTGRC